MKIHKALLIGGHQHRSITREIKALSVSEMALVHLRNRYERIFITRNLTPLQRELNTWHGGHQTDI